MEYINSIRNKRLLVHDNFLYQLKNNYKESALWVCRRRGQCTGTIKVFLDGRLIVRNHNHSDDIETIQSIKLKNSIIDSALHTTYTNREIFIKEIIQEDNTNITKKNTIYKNISNARKRNLFKIDSSCELPLHLQYTYKNEEFLLYNEENKMKIFSTINNLEYLMKSETWIADGTFQSAPFNYEQIYVIYGFIFKKCIPLVYILMNGKTEDEYLRAFQVIAKKISFYNPVEIMIDCETAPKNAFKKTFFYAKISHCLTHYSAAIHRNIIKLNLQFEYNNNKMFKTHVGMLKSIVFVPKKFINAEIQKLAVIFARYNDVRISEFFSKFLKFFTLSQNEVLYVKPEYYNYERLMNGMPLTSNHAEAFNNAISKDLIYSKVSLVKFVEVLRKRQGCIESDVVEALKNPLKVYSNKKQMKKMGLMISIANEYAKYINCDYLKVISEVYCWNV